MATPPVQSGPVLISQSPVPVLGVLRNRPPAVKGDFGGTGGGWRLTVDYLVNAWDAYKFCQFAAGNQYTVNLAGGATATRFIPLSHPDAPALICTAVDGTFAGEYTAPDVFPADTGRTVVNSNHSRCKVGLTFNRVPYPTDGSTPFLTTETRAGAEVYTLAGSKLSFPSDGSKVQADAGVVVPTVVYTVTIYMAVSLNDAAINPYLATPVNSAAFLGQPAGTMRFDGYNSSLQMMPTGQAAYTRTLMFTYRPVNWNSFLRPNGVWEAVQKPDGSAVYATADLRPLLS